MVEWVTLVNASNALTPLGIAGLLIYIIYVLVKGHQTVNTIADNHLRHIADGLHDVTSTLHRIETKQAEGFATLVTKVDRPS